MGTPVRPRVVVVGSINMDVVNRVAVFPRPGETVHAAGTEFHPGGKGANQAVAAAAAGGDVAMIGALGLDPFAATLREALRAAGVRTE
ncbi:MAG TPA: PfkB family carbohydrate kinase, partial [Dehalococcoidia bacterium]|nr:PfkB family carbohydrate kinase [Dehalococcoidia bacterium]